MQLNLDLGISACIPQEYQEQTHQVPKGPGSLFMSLENKKITASQAIILLLMNYWGDWNKGKSKFLSYRTLVKWTGLKLSRVIGIISFLKSFGWITPIKAKGKANRYEQTHHQELDPDEADYLASNDPLDKKFAMPYGPGSPIQRMINGEISWQACLCWCVYKLNSNFNTGVTDAISIMKMAKLTRLGHQTVSSANAELIQVGLMQRLTPKNQASQFQLYPKPHEKEEKKDDQRGQITHTRRHVISKNRKFRIDIQTGTVETKKRRKWVPMSDFERSQRFSWLIDELETARLEVLKLRKHFSAVFK